MASIGLTSPTIPPQRSPLEADRFEEAVEAHRQMLAQRETGEANTKVKRGIVGKIAAVVALNAALYGGMYFLHPETPTDFKVVDQNGQVVPDFRGIVNPHDPITISPNAKVEPMPTVQNQPGEPYPYPEDAPVDVGTTTTLPVPAPENTTNA